MTSRLDSTRLAVLVHEVRSPVAALAAVEETVVESAWNDATGRELVRLALAACRAIERIVMDAAVASVRMEPLDVGVFVREAVATLAVRGIAVATDVRGNRLVVDGDAIRLRQALDNLIANAVTHGDAQGVTVRATGSGGVVEVAVSDAGPGVPAEELERIFEMGVRLGRDVPGSGLGLPLARAIVDAHGGELTVESTVGTGSTFTMILPARPAQPDTRASSS